ncbi:MAG: hypothetical protein ACTHQQ_12555, partial [Solirubrobacteraceae bacterium]
MPITCAFATLLAGPLLGMSAGAAVMTGAILVVSGPTVARDSDTPVYRLAPSPDAAAPYTPGETLFAPPRAPPPLTPPDPPRARRTPPTTRGKTPRPR